MKEIIVLGDVELGAGTITDDFISDKSLSRLILRLARKTGEVDLVFNGDTFDFMKVNIEPRTSIITEELSLKKIKRIHLAHKQVFAALRVFASRKGKSIFFILGNHDQDIAFPGVQRYLRTELGPVQFPGFIYNKYDVHIEHGHQHDLVNKHSDLFYMHHEQKILHVPFGSSITMSSLLGIKEEHPFIERINPQRLLLKLHPTVFREITLGAMRHFVRVCHAFIFDRDHPILRLPSGISHEIYRRWKTTDVGVANVYQLIDTRHLPSLCVLGHRHVKFVRKGRTTIVLPDTWRDEYTLDRKTKLIHAKTKQYVRIIVRNGTVHSWKLVLVPIKRSVWRFKDIIKNEFHYVKLAAQEEGYTPHWLSEVSPRNAHR